MFIPSFARASHLSLSIISADVHLSLTTGNNFHLAKALLSRVPLLSNSSRSFETQNPSWEASPAAPHLTSLSNSNFVPAHSPAVTLLTVPSNYQNIRPIFLKLSQVSQLRAGTLEPDCLGLESQFHPPHGCRVTLKSCLTSPGLKCSHL